MKIVGLLSVFFGSSLLFTATAHAQIWDGFPVVLPDVGPAIEETRWRPQMWNSRMSEVSRLAFSPDGKTLFVGGSEKNRDYQTRVLGFDVATGVLRHDWTAPGQFRVTAMRFSDDGRWLAIGTGEGSNNSRQGSVSLWDRATNTVKWLLPGAVDGLDISADGRVLAVNDAGRLQIRDARTGALKRTFFHPQEQNMFDVALSPDGRWCVVNTFAYFERDKGRFGRIVMALWDLKTGRFSRDGKFLVAAFGGGVEVWNTSDWKKRPSPAQATPQIELRRRLWFADGTQVIHENSSLLGEGMHYLMNARPPLRTYLLRGISWDETAWAISPNGTWLATTDKPSLLEIEAKNAESKTNESKTSEAPPVRLQLWNVQKLWPEVVAGRAPSPYSSPETVFLRWARAINQGDWNRAAQWVEGASVSPALKKLGKEFHAQDRRLDVFAVKSL